jgi:hypothetical protein
MPSPGIRLGVDFGTSNTVAVVRWPDGRSRPLLFDGSPLLPSAVYAEPPAGVASQAGGPVAGALITGRDAVHSARLDPARFEPNPKRRIDDGTVLLGDRELPVGELMAAVLRRVRDEWGRTVGEVVPDVTLTFPASWGATRRLVVADAAQAAGLGRVRLVPEPVAAAAYFTQVLGRDVPIGSVVVVHDFGAGTFDASVVSRTASGFEVLAVDGRDDIGGIDIDDAIVAHIGRLCEASDPAAWQRLMHPTTVEDRRARRLLFDDARVAKERLSRTPAADLTVPLLNVDVHLTREELENLARPLLEQTIRVTQGVIRWAQLAEGRVAGVFLVGGSSRIPLVATMLHRALGEAPVAIEQPELVVAEGSLVGGAAPTPVTAGPAPGPATGVMPRVTPAGFPPPPGAGQQQSYGGQQPAYGGAQQPAYGGAGQAPRAGAGQQASGAGQPPYSGAGQQYGVAQQAPPGAGQQYGGAQQAPSGAGQQYGGTGQQYGGAGQAPSGTGQPGVAPVSGGPAIPVSAPPVLPISVPPAAAVSTPPASVSAPPIQPTSAPPVSAPPAGQRPVSAPPDRSAGRVFVSGSAPVTSVSPATYPVSPPPVRPVAPSRPMDRYDDPSGVTGPAYPAPRPPQYAPPQPQLPRQRGTAARLLIRFLVALLLIATPIVAGYIAFFLTTGSWPPPVNSWLPGKP